MWLIFKVNVIVYGKDGKRYPWNPDVFDEEFAEESFAEFMEMINKGKGAVMSRIETTSRKGQPLRKSA